MKTFANEYECEEATWLYICVVRSVAMIDTARVPSFALLPVSLFPVYLAVICFTKV